MSTFKSTSKLMSQQEPSLSDVVLAIKTHKRCVSHLEKFMLGQTHEAPDPDMVREHERCSLGRWLSTTCQAAYGDLPLIDEIIATHASLHFTARHILLRYYDGEHEEALGYLHEGALPHMTQKLYSQLVELANLIEKHHPGMATTMTLSEIVQESKSLDASVDESMAMH